MGGKLSPEKKRVCNARWREKNPTYDHDYYIKNRERMLKVDRAYFEKNGDKIRAKARDHYHKNPAQWKAEAIAKQIPIGTKCEICGSIENLERHHPNYDKPTEFVTVCCSCHRRIHQGKYMRIGVAF